MLRLGFCTLAVAAAVGLGGASYAQDKSKTVYMPALMELSGAGAVSGTNFRDGMLLTQQAEVPEIVGGEAAAITQKNDPYVFRTSFGQQFSMPKIANYMRDGVKAKSVAILWVNNDFGKGGRDTFIKEMKSRNIKVVADISTESGQTDFSADVVKLKAANADAIFVYTNEEESARFLREARKQAPKASRAMSASPSMRRFRPCRSSPPSSRSGSTMSATTTASRATRRSTSSNT